MYKIYPTLLDSYFRYKGSVDYKERDAAKQELIDKINRVREPEVEIQRRGKEFKRALDLLCDQVERREVVMEGAFWSDSMERCYGEFEFNCGVLKYFVDKLVWSVREYFTSANIIVDNEVVELYGYVDNIREYVIYDCKFVQKYDLAKYFSSQQRLVYPYCVNQQGGQITQFEFLATDGTSVFSEVYNWNQKRDELVLKKNIAEFINFVEKHRSFITDKKIVGQL